MGDKTGIEWTATVNDDGTVTPGATWNPTIGCTREKEGGCDHCYAFQLHDQRHVAWKRGTFPTAPPQYHQPFSVMQLMPNRLDQPLRWERPRKIFVNSLSDLFHVDVPDDYIDAVYAVMWLASRHTFQILTKRPQRMAAYLADPERPERIRLALRGLVDDGLLGKAIGGQAVSHADYRPVLPLTNVWHGTSVETQRAADLRMPHLMATRSAVRFVSAEPLLAGVDLRPWMAGVDWVIVGGESGPHARPMHPEWARSLRDQCRDAGVAYFMKQHGQWMHESQGGSPTLPFDEMLQGDNRAKLAHRWPDDTISWRVGSKKTAGHLLDGETHHAWPETRLLAAAGAR